MLIAAVVVAVLAGSLAVRLVGSSASGGAVPQAPAGLVSPPTPLAVDDLEVPCWSCPSSKQWPVRFRTDLDLLAPLGNGTANAAQFFKDFAKPDGRRFAEAEAAMAERVEGPEWIGKVLPADHPLLEEAAPWCDQASMRFYPDVFELEGYETRVPNLLFMLGLARSWIALGVSADDPTTALDHFRRAIRLGRLLRQEDTVIINDLVGLACIHLGARGIYESAIAGGDLGLALLASVVIGEVAPQRLLTSERITAADLASSGRLLDDGTVNLMLPASALERAITVATESLDRRFKGEAILMLRVVLAFGTTSQQGRAREVLDELADSDDPIVAANARWSRDTAIEREELLQAFDLK